MHRSISYQAEDSYPKIRTFLKQKGFSSALLARLKENPSCLLLNGSPAKLSAPLSQGDRLRVCVLEEKVPSDQITALPLPLDIIFEDEDLLVINKAAGMSIHPSLHHKEDSLANAVSYYYKDATSPFLFRCINRLDKETSGLTLIAKNPLSAAILSEMVQKRQIQRSYLALAEGELPIDSSPEPYPHTIDAPIGRCEDSIITRRVDPDKGQKAITHYRVLSIKKGLSLLSLKLETGRTHQIRIHMQFIGHPLPGDYLYNPVYDRISRVALHSASLTFLHPITKEALTFSAPLPDDMASLV